MRAAIQLPSYQPERLSPQEQQVKRQLELWRALESGGGMHASMPLEDVAKVMGLSRQRVSQIEQRALFKLRQLARRMRWTP